MTSVAAVLTNREGSFVASIATERGAALGDGSSVAATVQPNGLFASVGRSVIDHDDFAALDGARGLTIIKV